MFSGLDTTQEPLPEQFKLFCDHMNSKDSKYNQIVANWYENGNDYLSYHCDWEKNMTQSSDIATLTFYLSLSLFKVNVASDIATLTLNKDNDKCRKFVLKAKHINNVPFEGCIYKKSK